MSGQRVNRIEPALPAVAFRTYQIVSPVSTHFRDGTCEEAECAAYANGWRTVVDETSTLGQMQAHYVRSESRRRYTEEKDEDGMTVFTFAPGQRCFGQHKISLQRPEFFVRREGDWRGDPLGRAPLVHTRPEHWVEDFAEHQSKLAQQ